MILDQVTCLATIDARIACVRRHDGFSAWLRQALQAALDADPVTAANDAEMLGTLLRLRADAWVDTQLGTSDRIEI